MKYLPLFFVLALAPAAVAADPVITGKWDVATSIAGNDGTSVCDFTEKAGALSGVCTGDDGTAHPITGKVDGAKVNWSYKADYNGTPLTITFTGVVAEKQFKGAVEVDPMGISGDFTAKRK